MKANLARAPRRIRRRKHSDQGILVGSASKDLEERIALQHRVHALRGLAKTCATAKAFGGSYCTRVEKAAFAILRAMLCTSNQFDHSRKESEPDALRAYTITFKQWCLDLSSQVKDSTDRVCLAAESSPLYRCVRVVAMRKNLSRAAQELETLLTRYMQDILPWLEASEQRRVKQVLECVHVQYATYEVERDMRVRDMQEESLANSLRAELQVLHRLVLKRGEELRKQHEMEEARCARILKRMDCLGVDHSEKQSDRDELAHERAIIKLQPLPYSPRLLNLTHADVNMRRRAEIERFRSIPIDSRLRFYHINNHLYQDTKDANRKELHLLSGTHLSQEETKEGDATKSYRDKEGSNGIVMTEKAVNELPRRKALDDFWKCTDWSLAEEHRLVLDALATISACNPVEVVRELQRLPLGELGFRTEHLSNIKLKRRPTKGVVFAYLHFIGSPMKHAIALNHQREERPDSIQNADDDADHDPWAIHDEVDNRDEVIVQAEMNRARQIICHTLHIERFSNLLNESRNNKLIRRLTDVRPGDTIAVDAAEDSLRASVRVFMASSNVHNIMDLLARHLDDARLVRVCCMALTELLAADDFAGSADSVRYSFIQEGGVNMLLSVVDIFRSESVDTAGTALHVLHTICRWRNPSLLAELLVHKAVARCAISLYDFETHPYALEHACGILCIITETEPGRDAVTKLPFGASYICKAMLASPVKRAFAPAQRLGCECVANALLNHPINAHLIAQDPEDGGIRYLSEVTTRAPGNLVVYRTACSALARLAQYEGKSLLRRRAIALETTIHAMQRFHADEHIQAHGLLTLAYTVESAQSQRFYILCEKKGFERITECLSQKGLARVHWRAPYALCELVRSQHPRRRCTWHVFRAMQEDGVLAKLIEIAFTSSADSQMLFWSFRFLRLLLRSCTRINLIRPTLDGLENLDSSDSEDEGAGETHEQESGGEDDEHAEQDIQVEIPDPPPEPEVCKREKDESLASFLKRQAEAEAKAKALQDAYLKAVEEAKLPPIELREAWRATLISLGQDNLKAFDKAVSALKFVEFDPPAAKEALHLIFVWLQAVDDIMCAAKPAEELSFQLGRFLYTCRQEETVMEMLTQTMHIVIDFLEENLGERIKLQREYEQSLRRWQREQEEDLAFDTNSVFADIFRPKRKPMPPTLDSLPSWVTASLFGFQRSFAIDHLETARVRFAVSSKPLAASLDCLQQTLQKLFASLPPLSKSSIPCEA